MLSLNLTPFQLSDPVFADVKLSSSLTQTEIDLINSSNLLISLLHAFIDKGNKLTEGSANVYGGSEIELNKTGTEFVRLLGHELGHFYDDQIKKELNGESSTFAKIIDYEMDESQATAISFIIRQQIKLTTTDTDVRISNRIGYFTADDTLGACRRKA